jgi:hypothetical protein
MAWIMTCEQNDSYITNSSMLARIFQHADMLVTALLTPFPVSSTIFAHLSSHSRNPTIAKHSVPVATISTLVDMNKIDPKVIEWAECMK